jgi:hypothetical protein
MKNLNNEKITDPQSNPIVAQAMRYGQKFKELAEIQVLPEKQRELCL